MRQPYSFPFATIDREWRRWRKPRGICTRAAPRAVNQRQATDRHPGRSLPDLYRRGRTRAGQGQDMAGASDAADSQTLFRATGRHDEITPAAVQATGTRPGYGTHTRHAQSRPLSTLPNAPAQTMETARYSPAAHRQQPDPPSRQPTRGLTLLTLLFLLFLAERRLLHTGTCGLCHSHRGHRASCTSYILCQRIGMLIVLRARCACSCIRTRYVQGHIRERDHDLSPDPSRLTLLPPLS